MSQIRKKPERIRRRLPKILITFFQNHVPKILLERKEDGKLAFPKMDQIELSHIQVDSFRLVLGVDVRQVRDRLLRVVRMRADDPHVRRIGHVRVPRAFIDKQLLKELEGLVPSLVLFDKESS